MPEETSVLFESECQLSESAVNRFAGRASFLEWFEDIAYEFVDVEDVPSWKNDDGTAVILITDNLSKNELWNHLSWLASAVANMRPQEYDSYWHRDGLLIRMWWD